MLAVPSMQPPRVVQEAPEIDCDYEGPDFTCITFTPDWKRFHMTGMEADTIALLRKVCGVFCCAVWWCSNSFLCPCMREGWSTHVTFGM